MSEFQPALERTLRFEDAALAGTITYDSGGVTRFGVSSNAHPEVFPEMEECSRDRALEIASDIFKRCYWCFDGVADQNIANKLFDMAINMGLHTAIYLCQKIIGTQTDGTWGPRTEQAVNDTPNLVLFLRNASCDYYHDLANQDPEKYAKYLAGWLRRAAA